jgi:hypothetical protein
LLRADSCKCPGPRGLIFNPFSKRLPYDTLSGRKAQRRRNLQNAQPAGGGMVQKKIRQFKKDFLFFIVQ